MKALALGILMLLLFSLNWSQADPAVYPASRVVLSDGRIRTICKEPTGNVSTFVEPANGHAGVIECKYVDKNGKMLEWYQAFLDSNGHEILWIGRKSPGNHRSYDGIEEISVYTYNPDGNINEEYDYDGDGTFRFHTINVYSKETKKWIRGDGYDSTGVYRGSGYTPPEAHLYGEKKQQ